jgi:hypothetical protein
MLMNTTSERLSITVGIARLAFLRAEAVRLDISIGELIRRLVDQYREQRVQISSTSPSRRFE